MTQEEITAAINTVLALQPDHVVWATASEQQRAETSKQEEVFRQACQILPEMIRQAEDHDLFEALFSLACAGFNPPESLPALSAHFLLQLKPLCPLSCTDAICRISGSGWDISLREVPWYIVDQFRADAVYQGLDALEAGTEIQELRKELAVRRSEWESSHPTKGLTIKHLSNWNNMPYDDVCVRLDTIRYWTGILVRDEGGKIENWHPFWWRGDKPSAGE